MEHVEGRTNFVRKAWAQVDMTKEFPAHNYYEYADNGDGTITVSVPWSDFTVTTEGDRLDAKKAFTKAYLAFLKDNAEEQARLGPFMDARGYLPLSKRN
jgi:hypothetical protein